jgi:hypothetical protein
MPPRRRPGSIRDISHLYLSSITSPRDGEVRRQALVILESLSRNPWRAYLSSGLAAAMESQGAEVTLLEVGGGLPSAGYYFALDPGRYLRPVLEADSIVEAEVGRSINLIHARDPSMFSQSPDISRFGSSARVNLLAVERSALRDRENLADILGAARILPRGGVDEPGGWNDLPVFLLSVSVSPPDDVDAASGKLRSLFPAAPFMHLYPQRFHGEATDRDRVGGVDACPFPEELKGGMARRIPPSSPFLSGLAGEILQKLGSAMRKGSGHGR